jgi:hypothetical protein
MEGRTSSNSEHALAMTASLYIYTMAKDLEQCFHTVTPCFLIITCTFNINNYFCQNQNTLENREKSQFFYPTFLMQTYVICFYASVWPPLITSECLKQILMKLGMYVTATESISMTCFINPSHQSVCLHVYPPIIVKQWIG